MTATRWAFLAQNPASLPTEYAGWTGAGLLGLVLAWLLLVHLPNKDKQLGEMVKAHTLQLLELVKHFTEIISAKDRQLDEQRREFTGALRPVPPAAGT